MEILAIDVFAQHATFCLYNLQDWNCSVLVSAFTNSTALLSTTEPSKWDWLSPKGM
jgi:hypothetical protein